MNNELRTILLSLGTSRLIQLYGEAEVYTASLVMSEGITARRIVELINIKYGTQLLANKDIRNEIILSLEPEKLKYILDGVFLKNTNLTVNDADRLYKMRWGRSANSASRLIEVLGLNDEYLPPKKMLVPSFSQTTPTITLFPHQLRLKDAFVKELLHGKQRMLLHMPTGAGKTRTAVEGVIEYWKVSGKRSKNIIWIAHAEELCEQAFETFEKIWRFRGDKELTIYRLWGTHTLPEKIEPGSIIIAGFQKLHSLITSSKNVDFSSVQRLRKSAAAVLVDEAHKAVAPTYRTCIEFLSGDAECKVVGLTATPGRGTHDIFENTFQSGDGTTRDLADFFQNKKIGLVDEHDEAIDDPIKYLQDLGFLSKLNRKEVYSNIKVDLSNTERDFLQQFLELPKSVLNSLEGSQERNALILAEIANLYALGKNIILFALSVSHAQTISNLLNIKNIPSRSIDGKTSPHDRNNIINDYKSGRIRVIANYGVLTTGFDAPNTNAIVIARPTASVVLYSQMIGRGIRGTRVGGNDMCFLVDVVDNIEGFPSQNRAFSHFNAAWSEA